MAEINQTVNFNAIGKKIKQLSNAIGTFSDELEKDITEEIADGVNDIRNTILLSMKNTKRRGFSVFTMKGGKPHFPSAPLNPPSIDTGNLIGSIAIDVKTLEVEIGTPVDYGLYLETGTRKNLTKRPWLEPAANKHVNKIKNRIIGRLNQELLKKMYSERFL